MNKIQSLIDQIGMEAMESKDQLPMLRFIVQNIPILGTRDAFDFLCVGCGDGTEIEVVQEKYPYINVKGVDKNPKNASSVCVVGDMHDLPFEDKTFDCVMANNVLEHAVAPAVALEEMARVSKEFVIIVLPDEAWTEHGWHLIIPTYKQLIWLAERCGMSLFKHRVLRLIMPGGYLLQNDLYVFTKNL